MKHPFTLTGLTALLGLSLCGAQSYNELSDKELIAQVSKHQEEPIEDEVITQLATIVVDHHSDVAGGCSENDWRSKT